MQPLHIVFSSRVILSRFRAVYFLLPLLPAIVPLAIEETTECVQLSKCIRGPADQKLTYR